MAQRVKQIHRIRGSEQRRALTSPLRMEILGQFTANRALSIREIAERIGRPATGIHYHVRVLEQAGLLVRGGEHREGRRREALYRPVAERFELPAGRSGKQDAAALEVMSSAFRMAERDMESALLNRRSRSEGPSRNFQAMRLHLRLRPGDLKKINAQIDHLMALLVDCAARDEIPGDATEFCSLTLALLPLRDRATQAN